MDYNQPLAIDDIQSELLTSKSLEGLMISITPEYYSPEDFFRKHETSGNMRQICIAKILKKALEIIPLMESVYPDLKADVEIRILDSNHKVAQSSPYSIIISTGMVSHCIAAPCIPVEYISIAMEILGFEYDSLAILSVSWIIAHEYFHIARKHNEVAAEAKALEHRPYDNSIDNSLEHDADLLAVSAIYRFMQHKFSKTLHDMDIRRLTAYHIFFSLRTLKQESDDDIHSPMPERIYHLIQKLIQLTQNRTEIVSVSGLTEHSVERVQPILTVFIECEKHFNLTDGKDSELIRLLNETTPGSHIFQITESWQWISPLVEKITGTHADNRPEKNMGKPATCFFCKSTKLTKVSVISSWIVKKLDIKPGTQSLTNGALGLKLDDGTVSMNPALPYIRESKLGSENINRVCTQCNEEWLDPLNNHLKPIIENMIDGEFINLTKKRFQEVNIAHLRDGRLA